MVASVDVYVVSTSTSPCLTSLQHHREGGNVGTSSSLQGTEEAGNCAARGGAHNLHDSLGRPSLAALLGPCTRHVRRRLGARRAETEAILVSSGVRWQPFSEAALAELPVRAAGAAAWEPVPADLLGRRDLRDSFVVSVDPPG